MYHLLSWACIIVTATASTSRNLNYGSPSIGHPSLGISLRSLEKRQQSSSGFLTSELNFTHGVASGDPLADTVILWTRVAPTSPKDVSNADVRSAVTLLEHDSNEASPVSNALVCVQFKIARDSDLEKVADSGVAYTSSDIDFTVKVDARNLKPFTDYYYQFRICDSNVRSPLGRTKTSPEKDQSLDSAVRLAIYSCNNYPFGFFNAIGNPVRKDSIDFVVHLGDYIYEYKNGDYGWGDSIDRIALPHNELFTLYDYRTRLATYRTDSDLLASHQRYPWITVWDDHEVADNTWRDGSAELNNTEDSFIHDGGISVDQRKMNAVRAYYEWMPIRQVDMDDNLRIWRTFSIGSLFDLIMLDTRQYDRGITDLYWNTDYVHAISNDASRSLMGGRQESWFYKELSASQERGATWRLIGNQIVFSRINQSLTNGDENPLNYDAWNGYQANRNRTLHHIYKNKIDNTIFLAGDSHASWVSDLVWLDEHPYDPVTGEGSVGVEFAGTAVTSPCPMGENTTFDKALAASKWHVAANRELQWQDFYYRGYYELSIDYDAINASYFGLPDVRVRSGKEIKLASFEVLNGANKLRRNPIVGGGIASAGALKRGKVVLDNVTVDTAASL
ncbi:MAG: hypothetical protein M1825_003277 [Sarcosagium campestre]|nr:MAG: hypothetical protein M1825_003277 [Sarcosagium campestre]